MEVSMYKKSGLITYYALTPVHTGAGSSVSYIDLPVQRERHTSFPIMAGSGLKGVFRALAERDDSFKNDVNRIFGPENGSEGSSCVAFTDAKILLYPVRSVKNTFAWITCPFVLKRFEEDLQSIGGEEISIQELNIDDTDIIVSNESKLKIDNNKVGLEEFVFDVDNTQNADNLINAIKGYIPDTGTTQNPSARFGIVSDNVFTDLVNYAVEVRTRIKIDQTTGTASSGALFTVEMVPSETIFYSLVFADDPKIKNNSNDNSNDDANGVINKIKNLIDNKVIQVGGDETIGLGFVKVKFTNLTKDEATNSPLRVSPILENIEKEGIKI
jgi:CRISPR-associated protein Cmr4